MARFGHSGTNPLKIFLGLTMLMLFLGIGIAVVGVQNQTSTQSEAARKRNNNQINNVDSEAVRANPFVFSNPRSELVGGGYGQATSPKCKVYLSTNIKNTSSKKRTFTYAVDVTTLIGGQLVASKTLTATTLPKQTRIIGTTISEGLIPGEEYNPKITLINVPEKPNRPNYRTWQSFRMPNNCQL